MNRTEKSAQIEVVKGKFEKAVSAALIDYQGLSVETVTALRREFKKGGVEYKVLKNTVIRHALKGTPYLALIGDLSRSPKKAKAHAAVRGMTGVAWSYSDPAAAVKIIEQFKKSAGPKADKLNVKTGMVSGDLIDGEALGKLPGIKDLQGQIVGLLQAPGAQLYTALVGPGAMIVAILEASIAKRKAAGETE